MSKLWLLLLLALPIMGCEHDEMGLSERISTPKGQPLEVKFLNAPAPDPRFDELEARITTLENWAVKQGGRFK